MPGYAAVDAQAAFDFGHRYTIEGSAVNLADRHTYDPYEYFGFAVAMPNQPLAAYLTLKIHLIGSSDESQRIIEAFRRPRVDRHWLIGSLWRRRGNI
jgi:hypothetical protein